MADHRNSFNLLKKKSEFPLCQVVSNEIFGELSWYKDMSSPLIFYHNPTCSKTYITGL